MPKDDPERPPLNPLQLLSLCEVQGGGPRWGSVHELREYKASLRDVSLKTVFLLALLRLIGLVGFMACQLRCVTPKVIWRAYVSVSEEESRLLKVNAHEVQAIATSVLFRKVKSLDLVLKPGMWKSMTTFASFYLQDVTHSNKIYGYIIFRFRGFGDFGDRVFHLQVSVTPSHLYLGIWHM
ncbi:hypothetical protein E2C01_048334 [Portunus trituberculatus]|uniref:Uncharacterized protein n=1 Tax=Portunus trituberculatus TaxID=210409 RepID=A0A5B7GBA4_PORTR|nr:hypothetical protein [Portunus trituberculatus]